MWNYPFTLHVRLNAGCKIRCQQWDWLRWAWRSFLFKLFISRCMAAHHSGSGIRDGPHESSFASLNGVRTFFSKPSILFISIMLRVGKVTLLLESSQFRLMGAYLMRAWSYHAWLLPLLTHNFSPQTTPIIGTGLEHSFYLMSGFRPN